MLSSDDDAVKPRSERVADRAGSTGGPGVTGDGLLQSVRGSAAVRLRTLSSRTRSSRAYRHARGATASAITKLNGSFGLDLPTPTADLKIHGQVRTGTNYLAELVRLNLMVHVFESDEAGWKHGPIELAAGTSFVIITKDPYRWLVSFRNWEQIHHRSGASDLALFARAPVTHPRLRAAWAAADPIDAWNLSMASWLAQVDAGRAVLIRYEDLLRDLHGQLGRLEQACCARRRVTNFVDVSERVDTWPTPEPRHAFERAKYLPCGPPAEFSDDALELMRERLAAEIIERLGYTWW